MAINSTQAGLGIRAELFEPVFDEKPTLGFFEAHSENYFGDSIARAKLLELREDYPISLHGVGLSLGRADQLDTNHLKSLKTLIDAVEPALVSEHLAWSAYSHTHLPDLLPLPLTDQAMQIICQHINQMQDALGRQILLENPSNYLLFDQLQIPEPEFLNAVAEQTGCGLLLDVNNVAVSANNLQRDPLQYVEQINSQFIGQYHLAGYTPVEKNGEKLFIDTHNQAVYSDVWQLFQKTIEKHGVRPTLFEWDSDFPEFSVLLEECQKATALLESGDSSNDSISTSLPVQQQSLKKPSSNTAEPVELAGLQEQFLNNILEKNKLTPRAIEAHQSRIWVYQNNVYVALIEYLEGVFPAVAGVVGNDYFKQLARIVIKKAPPPQGNIHEYGDVLARIVEKRSDLKHIPYLKDLIAYEWALHCAYYANNDSDFLVTEMEQDELLTTKIHLKYSVYYLRSQFPIYEIHRQSLPSFSGKVDIGLTDSQDAILVYKRDYEVITKVLTADEALFLNTVTESDNLLQAIESVDGSIKPETTSAILSFIFENNLLMKQDGKDLRQFQTEYVA